MKGSLKISFLLAAFGAAVVLGGCSSGGSSHSTPVAPETATTVDAGQVVQAPVQGATVFADRVASGTVYVFDDADEEKSPTVTDQNGDFTQFEVPVGYGDFILVSTGGFDTLTSQPAGLMLAPADADRVTPLTTLVALVTDPDDQQDLKDALSALSDGAGYDSDPSENTPEFVALTQMVEEAVTLVSTLAQLDSLENQLVVSEAIATSLVANVDDVAPGESTAGFVTTGVSASIVALIEDGKVEAEVIDYLESEDFDATVSAFVLAVEAEVDSLEIAVDGTVLESDIDLDVLETANDDAYSDALEDGMPSFVLRVENLKILDNGGDLASQEVADGVFTVALNAASKIQLELGAFNTMADAQVDTAAVVLSITDVNSRIVTFTLTGVKLTTTTNDAGALVSVDLNDAVLDIVAVGSETDVTIEDVKNLGDVVVATGNTFVVNLETVYTRLVANSPAIENILLTGDYNISWSAVGTSLEAEGVSLTVE